jgi:hypothetical protein
VVDDADDAEVELAVRLQDLLARQPGALMRRPQVRAMAVVAPILIDELAELQRILAELEFRNLLRHVVEPPALR